MSRPTDTWPSLPHVTERTPLSAAPRVPSPEDEDAADRRSMRVAIGGLLIAALAVVQLGLVPAARSIADAPHEPAGVRAPGAVPSDYRARDIEPPPWIDLAMAGFRQCIEDDMAAGLATNQCRFSCGYPDVVVEAWSLPLPEDACLLLPPPERFSIVDDGGAP